VSEQLRPVATEQRERTAEPVAMQDGEIISGLNRGQQDAWTTLYDLYSGGVWRYVARLVGADANAVADIVQETMLAAAQSARNFDEAKGTLRQWLIGIAHNRVSNYWRDAVRIKRLQKSLAALEQDGTASGLSLLSESTDSPALPIEQQETADIVRATLAKLPVDYAALLTAKYIDELSVVEIQDQTGGTSDAVRSKMVRARQEFRETFTRLANGN